MASFGCCDPERHGAICQMLSTLSDFRKTARFALPQGVVWNLWY
jgi:hypothetical protein